MRTIQFLLISLLLVIIAVFFNFCFNYVTTDKYENTSAYMDSDDRRTIIIDAGHGGEDGGAVGVNNVLEKDLNLEISLVLADIFKSAGYNVIMTRADDRMLYTEYKRGTLKSQDLKYRLSIAEQNPEAVFLSIHMNMFPQARYSGLQVYYSANNDLSQSLAETVQSHVREYIQPENNRKIKKSDSRIYLMKKITTPAILIECGFLSNYEEAELLADTKYRHMLACVIYCAVDNYITNL
jgi:N-acetylmuramoyl-L-alanine amidase